MKKVYIARDLTEAHLVKGLLEAEDIPAIVQGEYLFAIRGEIPITTDTSPSVWVIDDAHVERARLLVRLFDRPENRQLRGQLWQCPQCGETLEGQFTECWQCGASRLPKV